ncbi:MAG: rod shape-determining protein MreC, partial [bacterium]
ASNYTSRILFILDPGNTVSVRITRNNVMGVLKGDGNGNCNLLYIPSGADVKIGDMVSTSESSEIYPGGIPVGRIINVSNTPGKTFLDITVSPTVDFSSMYYLWIVR